jgi:hypothetical protein
MYHRQRERTLSWQNKPHFALGLHGYVCDTLTVDLHAVRESLVMRRRHRPPTVVLAGTPRNHPLANPFITFNYGTSSFSPYVPLFPDGADGVWPTLIGWS